MIPRTAAEPVNTNSLEPFESPPAGSGPAIEMHQEGMLTEEVLLRICRVSPSDPQVTPEWIASLQLAARLVVEPSLRRDARLEAAMTLIASALGRLTQFNPTHLPFGYDGPRVQPRDWIERGVLERVGKQIVGLMWPCAAAEAVAGAVQRAVSEGIRLGFLEQREYDAWRPGMRSGSGWRAAISATPYGVMKARGAVAETPDTSAAAAPTPRNPKPVDEPVVRLGRPGEPCVVLGEPKKPLTDGQYAVVSALLKAGEDGLNKDAMEAVRPSARRILKQLRADADWAEVMLLPGQTNGRYRIRA